MKSRDGFCWIVWLIAVLFMGCGGGDTTPATEEVPEEKREAATSEILVDIEEDRLVQVLVYGLGVFKDEAGQVTVYYPAVGGHEITLAQGKVDSPTKSTWVGFGSPDPLRVEGRKISLLGLAAALYPWEENANHGNSDRYPKSQADAGDVRWRISAKGLDSGITSLNTGVASTTAVFSSGRFETCGLVHDPYPPASSACRVKVVDKNSGDTLLDKTSASEYMVFRQAVADTVNEIQIKVEKRDGTFKTYSAKLSTLAECSEANLGACVSWKGEYYREVFDIALRNVPEHVGERIMETEHLEELKRAGFFPGHDTTKKWKLTTPDCTYDEVNELWDCRHCNGLQPTCWQYFLRYRESMGGVNQPICPFVKYP